MVEKSFLFIRRRRRTNEPLLGLKWAPLHRRGTSVATDDSDDDDEDPASLSSHDDLRGHGEKNI